ncbi:MAG: TIM barrel protein [Bryobacteraceae bacterium]
MPAYLPVLHSVSYAGAWPGHSRLDLDQFLGKAVELGYRRVALVAKQPHLSPVGFDSQGRRALKARVRELGLEVAALMGYTDFTAGLDRPGIPSAEMNAAYVGAVAKLAADLEVTRLRIFTGYRRAGIPYDAQYGELVMGLRLAAKESARFGVTLLLQNHHDLACHHDQLAWLLEEVNEPNLKAAFDAWEPHLQGVAGEELVAAVKKLGPWLAFTTVADYVAQPRFRYDTERVNYTGGTRACHGAACTLPPRTSRSCSRRFSTLENTVEKYGGTRVFSPATARAMTINWNAGLKTPRGLGWALSGFGDPVSTRTFGHSGATGTIAWADPETQLLCVILTNRELSVDGGHLLNMVSNAVASSVETQ